VVPPRAAVFGLVTSRIFTVALGCVGIVWGVLAFPVFWQQSPLEHTAERIIAGDAFKRETLMKLGPTLDAVDQMAYCRPAGSRSAAIIRLRLLEEAIAAAERIDDQMDGLDRAIRHSLACSPADPFLWLVLFWVENNRSGFSPDHLGYLRMSYLLGPNEGWIALKRNGRAVALFRQLPSDLREMAVTEFARLVDSLFYDAAADILAGAGWQVRDILLARLGVIGERRREGFAKVLDARDYDLQVPGIVRPPPHPWQR
jgi:hypothetical protein